MTIDEARTTEQEAEGLVLDPFSFHGYPTSCIAGIGGTAHNPDPHYAFHTEYVPVRRGHAHFTVRLDALSARNGTLWLRVHMLPREPGAVGRLVTGERIQLNRLVQMGGEVSLRFEAFRGATYALMGLIQDQHDASAQGLTITLDRPAGAEDEVEDVASLEEARTTRYAAADLASTRLLVSLDPPQLTQPVSQPATEAQLREPVFRARIGTADSSALAWARAYVVQVLDRYGMLQAGARGLGLGVAAAAADDMIAAAGPQTLLVATDGQRPDPASLVADHRAYDFLWSIGMDDAQDPAYAERLVETSMECLRPGGLAVHVLRYRADGGVGDRWGRGRLERLAIAVVSRGHDLARLKPALGARLVEDEDGMAPFGLIARRARSVL